MFRSTTGSGCHGIFQRGRHCSKDESASRKFSTSSNGSTMCTTSSGRHTRSTSVSSATAVSSRSPIHGCNPLSLHPPFTINKPPKIDDDAVSSTDFILEEDESDFDAYFRPENFQLFHQHHEEQLRQGKAVTPFSPNDYDQFRFPAPREQSRRRRLSEDKEDESPCPDVDWELEQHIPIDGAGWHKSKRSDKRKAMLLRPGMVHTAGTYI